MTQLNVNVYYPNIFILLPKLIVLLSFNSSVHIRKMFRKRTKASIKSSVFHNKVSFVFLLDLFLLSNKKNIGAMLPHLSPERFARNLEFVSFRHIFIIFTHLCII